MNARIILTMAAGLAAIAASDHLAGLPRQAHAQTSRDSAWTGRTLWGDPDLQGEWTAEGEYGVPFERPPQFGTRQLLTDEEYAKRLEDVRIRDERDLAPVDVLSGKVDAPNAPAAAAVSRIPLPSTTPATSAPPREAALPSTPSAPFVSSPSWLSRKTSVVIG